jgi:hypothetical protein
MQQIRKILPRSLTAPKPLYDDRRARHFEIASILRVTQAEKWELTKAKAKAMREANKARKYQQQRDGNGGVRDGSIENEDSSSDRDADVQEGVHTVCAGTKRCRNN